jgi:hypothetical protein
MKSVDPLGMHGWATKVDSIGARLGSEDEFDGINPSITVESSNKSRVDLFDSENRATLDRHNLGVDKLTRATADTSGWSARLECAQISTETMSNPRCVSSPETGTDRVRWQQHTQQGRYFYTRSSSLQRALVCCAGCWSSSLRSTHPS